MSKNQLILGLICFILQFIHAQEPGLQPTWNSTISERLRKKLLLNYDKYSRPTEHYNSTTLQFGLEIKHLDVDEFKSIINVHSWAKMVWMNEKFRWDPEDYEGITLVHMSSQEVWLPDVFLFNSYNPIAMNMYGKTLVLVYRTGEILWVPPATFSAICDFDFTFWPFDVQDCALTFGSWTHDGDKIDLKMYTQKALDAEDYTSNKEWKVVSTASEINDHFYSCCNESYPAITMTLTVQRSSSTYKALITTPAIAIIMLTLMNFWLPPQAGEKIILNGITATLTIFSLIYFAQKIPGMGSRTPLIVLFLDSSLYIVCFSMANSILILWISRTKHTKPIPSVLKNILFIWLGKWLCLSPSVKESSGSVNLLPSEESRNNQNDWLTLALIIDRIAFLFYGALFVILSAVYCL